MITEPMPTPLASLSARTFLLGNHHLAVTRRGEGILPFRDDKQEGKL